MSFDLGDLVELDFGKNYLIAGKCKIDLFEYYLALEREDESNSIIIKTEPEREDIVIVKDESEIRKALEQIGKVNI